jgi:MFS family permease
VIDRFRRKGLLGLSVFLYGLAGSSGFLLDQVGLILLGRMLLGFSVAGIMTTATTLIVDYYMGAARAKFLGLQARSWDLAAWSSSPWAVILLTSTGGCHF